MREQIRFNVWDEGNEVMHHDVRIIDSGLDDGWIVIVDLKDPDWDQKLSLNVYFRKQLHVLKPTGLKDKNGKEAYEGDIVYTGARPQIIKWSDTIAGWAMWLGKGATTGIPLTFEVIGNIYETPELLGRTAIESNESAQ